MKKRLSLLLALLMALTTCMASAALAEAATAPDLESVPMVAAYSPFNQKFSIFFADTAYDQDVTELLFPGMLTTDRMGGIITNAIEGETVSYNGVDYLYTGIADTSVAYDEAADITTYTAKLREDLVWSDGEKLDADDVIFTYYVYLDPAYVGSATLSSYSILGLQDYRTQTTADVYAKYNTIAQAIYAAGSDHVWAEGDAWTQEQQDAFWAQMKTTWEEDLMAIVNYVVNNYAAYVADLGYTAEDLADNEGLRIALGMYAWGFGGLDESGLFASGTTGDTFDIAAGTFPTIEDLYNEAYAKYAGDPVAYYGVEAADSDDVLGTATSAFISAQGATEEGSEGGIPNIAGIKKLDDYTVEVKVQGFEAPAVYSIQGIQIAPLHYYGDPAQYDYENNQFGHPFGDLSLIESKTTQPLVSAGPYKFVEYANKTVYFEANETYYAGEPATKYLQYKETTTAEVAPGVQTGVVDTGELSVTKDNVALLQSYNANGEVNGDVAVLQMVDNLGYGYIGLNADTVRVGEDSFSAESANLRKAIATVLSVYRDVAVDSYYGEAAGVINYPISNTSWAAPQPTDEDYKVAFSTDVEGNPIYTSEMTSEERYAAAVQAAIGYLKAAGFTFDEATGLFTAAPEGAKLSYEALIPGDGIGDHPSFSVLNNASEALATIGITLKITDLSDSSLLWDTLDAGAQELWCAAWGSTIDPDMYQVYHSSGIVGRGGSDSNHYHIALDELDQLIVDARQSADQAYRKAIYKQALDLIVDQAVEIPVYQRKLGTIFSAERIDLETLTPDMTTFWGWQSEIEAITMNANK